MRISYTIDENATVCGGVNSYTNLVGWQGDNGSHATLTMLLGSKEQRDILELDGDFKHVEALLESALNNLRATQKVSAETLGEKRPTGCPHCMGAGLNATHTADCSWSKRANTLTDGDTL